MGDLLDTMASSFWSMFDHAEKDIAPMPSADAYNFPECDYDKNVTNLYKQIEAQNWTSVNHFLLTGYWSGSFFADSTPPTEQACTWVTKYDPNVKRKKVLWTHLPIHAALSFGAPEGVVQILVKLAPPTLRCADDQRMLPLHLAFRRGATDTTIAVIMDVFPEGVAVRDFLGRTPAECSSEGPNPKRGTIIQTVLYYNQKAWEKKAAKAQEQHLETIRATLKQRTEKIENIQTAFDLVRCREDQSRLAFTKVMSELGKFKGWYDEQTPSAFFENGGVLNANFVRELTDRLDQFYDNAEHMSAQQKKAKQDLDSTLIDLKAVWDVNGWSNDVKLRSFGEIVKHTGEEQSDASSNTSLITSSTAKKEAANGQQVAKPIELPSLFKVESTMASKAESKAVSKAKSKANAQEQDETAEEEKKVEPVEEDKAAEETPEEVQEEMPALEEAPIEEAPKAETQQAAANVEVTAQVQPNKFPDVVSLEKSHTSSEEGGEIKQTISEMTSLDMSEQGSKATSSSRKKGFRLALSRMKKSSKGSKGSKDSVNGSLPPKNPTKQSKPSKLTVMKKAGGSAKVSPTL